MNKLYDREESRLIYCGHEADPEFWDNRWKDRKQKRVTGNKQSRRDLVVRTTSRYLTPDSGPILEGGCGPAHKLAALTANGFDCIGIDYAEETVATVSEIYPDLDIRIGDVRKLDFDDNTFAGYWSLGVIEHFWDGYEPIADEMYRVLKPGGYLFLTFPAMNTLRRIKAGINSYESFLEDLDEPFYQFALETTKIQQDFARRGFEVRQFSQSSVLTGLEDELDWTRPLIQLIKRNRHRNTLTRKGTAALNLLLDTLFGRLAGHSSLSVLQKTG